jgi:hypothetical protein
MTGFRKSFEQIWQAYSGEAAWQMVVDLCRFHRIQASPGYRRAAQLLHQRLVEEGLEAEIVSLPADEKTQFWAWPSFMEWDCSEATLHLVEPENAARAGLSKVLADFRANPISLIQRSAPFEGEAKVVLLQDGEEEDDYAGLEVAGRVVLTRGDLRRVWELAVVKRGAVGILFDGMRPVDPVRPAGDLADVRQYTSFWWLPGDVKCFGFVLTPRQGNVLRRLLKGENQPKGTAQTVRIRAHVVSRLYDGAMEVVSTTIPGQSDKEIVVVAHLCHPRPSANDNASGAAAAWEAARTLHSLVDGGKLPVPRRTIRFLWVPEMNGMVAYLANRETDLRRMVAGINLDMVGEDQDQTGSSWLLERPPEAAASFAPDLLAWLRDQMPSLPGIAGVSPSHTGMGEYPLYRQAEVSFSGGSDHVLLSDPSVGVPTPMLIQWPDRFYHTAADTPDRTDPLSLARSGVLAAAYAYWLSSAGSPEATWLGYEMVARFKARLARMTQETVTAALNLEDGQALAQVTADLDRRLAYLLDRQKAALGTLARLAPVKCPVDELQDEAVRVAGRELAWAKGGIDLRLVALGLDALPPLPPRELSEAEQVAAELVPIRLAPGPIPLNSHLPRLSDEDREAWRKLLKEHKGSNHYTLLPLAQYWADGARSVLQIADQVELESGLRDVELLLAFFRLVEKLELIRL